MGKILKVNYIKVKIFAFFIFKNIVKTFYILDIFVDNQMGCCSKLQKIHCSFKRYENLVFF